MKNFRFNRYQLPIAAFGMSLFGMALADVSEAELRSIQTPPTVQTSIGELTFFDGVPTRETADRAGT